MHLWTQVYWLHLDYLEVAAAALRCAAPFTALLYLEHWCKAAHGHLTLGAQDLLCQVWGCDLPPHALYHRLAEVSRDCPIQRPGTAASITLGGAHV